jgi:hypothetical protein
MIRIAPTSSNMAREVWNILSDIGTREPSRDNIPNAKAMSVVAGIAQPFTAIGHCS